MEPSTVSNTLTVAIEQYIQQQDAAHAVCSIDDILKITSKCVTGILPAGKTASVELHHFEPYTTVVITVPGSSDVAKHGPYTYRVRTN